MAMAENKLKFPITVELTEEAYLGIHAILLLTCLHIMHTPGSPPGLDDVIEQAMNVIEWFGTFDPSAQNELALPETQRMIADIRTKLGARYN